MWKSHGFRHAYPYRLRSEAAFSGAKAGIGRYLRAPDWFGPVNKP
jgi:hypothetical protein